MDSRLPLLDDEAMRQFLVNGYLTLQTDMPEGFNERLCERLDATIEAEGNWGNNILPRIPEIRQIFRHPAIDGALTSLLGPNYIMHPHRYPHRNVPGSAAQALHKDLTHYSGDKDIQHHRTRWAMVFYYPHDVTAEMGPTSILPGTQFYQEESHDPDNAERLLCGKAGTATVVNFDIWHRATANRSPQRRYMLKFIFARMEEPSGPSWRAENPEWLPPRNGVSPDKHEVVWRSVWNWHHGRGADTPEAASADADALAENLRLLNAGSVSERRQAANRLGLLGPMAEAAIPALAAALRDADEPLRLNAGYALGAIGAAAIPALREEVRIGTEESRRHAACGLSLIGKAAVPALLSLAEEEDWRVRSAAVDALSEIGPATPEVVPALDRALGDPADWVRRHAADALGTIGKNAGAAVPALARTLMDAQPYVRINAATALAKIGPEAEEAVPALIAALDDPDRYTRAFAAIALRRIGTPAAQEALLDLLETARWCPITTIAKPY
ncbi:MAG TPA: HEAT repeat domain-containing protein [Chthonomonadaceae bacterium]|nr:HEAT repeat domain-containing protein [Chthonomonadaceae bacterium]